MDKLLEAILKGKLQLFTLKDLKEIRENVTRVGEYLKQMTLYKGK